MTFQRREPAPKANRRKRSKIIFDVYVAKLRNMDPTAHDQEVSSVFGDGNLPVKIKTVQKMSV